MREYLEALIYSLIETRILIGDLIEKIKFIEEKIVDKQIRKIEKETKKVGKDLKSLEKMDKKRDPKCEMGEKMMKKKKK